MVDKVDIRWTVTVDVHDTDHGTVVSFIPTPSRSDLGPSSLRAVRQNRVA
jgi:hypothetical protein